MSWEIWQQEQSWVSDEKDKCFVYRIGFFCNTADVGFGPVLTFEVNNKFDDARDEIYSRWDTNDPRSGDMTDSNIADEINRIMEMEE
jgi:hypothetical protein